MVRLAGWSPLGRVLAAISAVLAVVLLLSGCTGASAPEGSGRSAATPTVDADLRGTMTVAPASAVPGQEVTLRFPAGSHRGIAFSLSRWSRSRWTAAYYLTSDWGTSGDHTPSWWAVEDSENRGWEQVGVSGPGPDRVLVPETAPPGDYLVCTANALDEACAVLTVTG